MEINNSPTNTEMPQIPDGWITRKLSDFGYSYSGLSGKSKDDFGSGSAFVPFKNVFSNTFLNTENLERVEIDPKEDQNKVKRGDVLLTISSETPEEVGMSSAVTSEISEDVYLNSFCFGFRQTTPLLDEKYSGYAFRSNYIRKKITFLAQGSTRYNISKSKVLEIELAIPPLPEQQKIAAILTAVDDKLDVIARQIEATQTLKRGLMQTLFSRGVGTQDTSGRWVPHTEFVATDSGKYPANWQWVRMGDVAPIIRREANIQDGHSYPELGLRSFGKGTFHKPAIKGSELGGKRLFIIKSGDLLLSNVFAWEGSIAVAKPEDDGRYGSHRYITCKVDASRVDVFFIARYLITPPGLVAINLASPGGAGRNKTLGLTALENIKIPVPPLDEQNAITASIDAVEAKLRVLEIKRESHQTLKRGLMQKLLTGAWRVKVDAEATAAPTV